MQPKTIQRLSIAFFAALILVGGFTLFYYLGVPVHRSVLLSDGAFANVEKICTSTVCRGVMAFFPFLMHTLGQLAPFGWYIAISLIVILGVFVYKSMQTGEKSVRFTVRPWHFYAAFVFFLWLLFTVLTSGLSSDGNSLRTIAEPTAQVYQGIPEDSLKELQNNFQALMDRGCLVADPVLSGQVNIYNIRLSCVQWSFVTRVFMQLLMATVLLFELLIAGHMILTLLWFKPKTLFAEGMMSMGIGIGVWVFLLWLVATIGIFTPTTGWVLALIIPVACYRSALYWGKRFHTAEWDVDISWKSINVLLIWLLLSYLALNFLTVIRPFPIGWDDLGSYINRPRLLVSYEHIIPSMFTFQWEYLTSLGFLLFGYTNPFGATAAMVINWTEGLLALLAVMLFGRTFLGKGRGLLAAIFYYMLPMVGHFSFADMKIDNAVFLMGALATYAVFCGLVPSNDDWEQEQPVVPTKETARWKWLLLGGIFVGLAFGFKPTAAMVLLALFATVGGLVAGWQYFVGLASLSLAFLVFQGSLNVSVVMRRLALATQASDKFIFLGIVALVGIAFIVWGTTRKLASWRSILQTLGVFVAGFAISVLPWLAYNNAASGSLLSPKLILTGNNLLSPEFVIDGSEGGPFLNGQVVRRLPKELAVDTKNPACMATSRAEELDRYWGFNTGFMHYLTLPWRAIMDLDSAGYYVTESPMLLLFVLLLLLPLFWMKRGRWLRYLFAGTVFIILQWIFLGNGIPWYGIGMFLGLVLGVEALFARAPDLPAKITSGILIGVSIVIMLGMRLWQFDQQRNLIEYPMGKISAAALEERTIPWYNDIAALVTERHNTEKDRPYLYRIGTFIPYFIPKNLEVIGNGDQQLDFFNCINQERNPALTTQRLKALGFNSIVYDTNTETIEEDPNGSLHKKVNAFIDYVNSSGSNLQGLVNDPSSGIAFILIR